MDFDTNRFDGVFTALVTPFRDGAVDVAALEALVEGQVAAGVAGLASSREIAFVILLLAIVLLAPKVPRIGEAIGRRFGDRDDSGPKPGN